MNDTTMTIRLSKQLKQTFDLQVQNELMEAIKTKANTKNITQSGILRALITLYCKETVQ